MSSSEVKTENKGRLSWVITVLEIIVIIAYFLIGFGGLANAFKNMSFSGMFESVKTAIIFLIVATSIITILCFVPVFKSKANIRLAIWNIIWMGFTLYSFI